MAQQNRREIELALEITTANADALSKLRDDVKELAKSGGDAAPEFKRLADELGKLEAQARQLETLDALSADLNEVKQKQDAATAAFKEASAVLDTYKARVNEIKAAESAKNLEIKESVAAAQQASAQLKELRATTDAAGKTTLAYITRVRELSQVERENRETAAQGRVERERLQIALREANGELRNAGTAYREAKNGVEQYNTSVAGLEKSIERSNRALIEAGGQSIRLGDSQQKLAGDLAQVKEAIRSQITEIERKAQAEREASREAERLAAIELNTKKALQAQAKAEADGTIRDYQRMEQAQREAAQAAQLAGQRIRDAFGTVGAKSVQALRDEIQRVRDAMQLLASSGAATGRELDEAMRQGQNRIKELEREIREATGSLTLMDKASSALKSTIGQLAAFVSLVEVVQRTGRAFLEATQQIEALRLGLKAVYGDAGIAAQQIEALRRAANAGGVAVGDISQAFVKFSASAKESGIPLQQTNRLFNALTVAAGTLGLRSTQTERALEALSQMAAKGVVNMEELRQQLGDALPGALALTAKGLGITQQELFKLVEQGQLTANDLFPALTKSLEEIGGEINTLNAQWARLRNTVTLSFQAFSDAGALTVLKSALQGVSAALGVFALGLVTLTEALRTAFVGTGTFIGILAGGGGLKEALAAAGKEAEASANRLVKFQNGLFEGGKQSDLTKRALSDASDALAGVGLAADTAGAAWIQLGVGATKANEVLRTSARLAEEAAKAAEIEGNARMTLAKVTGDQNVVLQTNIEVTQKNLEKLQAVAEARRQEVEALRVQYEAAKLIAATTEDEQRARAASLIELEKQIELRGAVAERSREEAGAAQAAADAARIAAQTYADNSARLGELTEAYEQSKMALAALVELEAQGFVTKEQLQEQVRLTAEAQALYNDALKDTEALARAVNAEERAAADLKASNLRVQEAVLRAEIDIAKAKGDTYRVNRLQKELTDLQIRQSQLLAEAKRAEAASLRASAESARANLVATNQWTAAAEAAYRASIAKANALDNEAKIADVTAQRLRELAKVTDQAGVAATRASGGYDKLAGSLQQTAAAAEKAAKASGDTTLGNTAIRGPSVLNELQQRAAAGDTLGPKDAQTLQELVAYFSELRKFQGGTLAFSQDAAKYQREAQELLQRVRTPAQSQPTTQPAGTPVTINLNGASTNISVASPADASALQGVLQQLARQSTRATI
jgi:tape measure domain-containing protein